MIIRKSEAETAKLIVYYAYAIMCSTEFLKKFKAVLFTTVDTENRPRIPIALDAERFLSIAEKVRSSPTWKTRIIHLLFQRRSLALWICMKANLL